MRVGLASSATAWCRTLRFQRVRILTFLPPGSLPFAPSAKLISCLPHLSGAPPSSYEGGSCFLCNRLVPHPPLSEGADFDRSSSRQPTLRAFRKADLLLAPPLGCPTLVL